MNNDNIFKTFLSIIILTLLISCNSKQLDESANVKKETPKALKDDKLDIKSFGRLSSSNLTKELYEELVSKSPDLKRLEHDIYAYGPMLVDQEEKFNNYNFKSIKYYNSANNIASEISDSLLKNKIISLIKSSNNNYIAKTSEFNALLEQISKNEITISDYHAALKISLTIPLIEEYQKNNIPNKKDINDVIKKQKNVMLHADSLIPKY